MPCQIQEQLHHMRHFSLLKLGFSLFLILFLTELTGQSHFLGTPQTINFSKSEYTAGTQNWSIYQDDRGIMYFGNNKGVLEYDGTNWTLTSMPNRTVVRSLAKGPNERLFVGAQDELGYISLQEGPLYTYHSLVQYIPESYRSFDDIWKIFPYKQDVFFCSQRGVFHFQGTNCKVVPPKSRFENFFFLEGTLYAQDIEEGLLRFNGTEFSPIPGGQRFTQSRIASILLFQGDTLIISDTQGLLLMDASGIRPWDTPVSTFLKANQAYCATRLQDTQLAIGTTQDGVIVMDTTGQITLHLNTESGLQNNTVLSVFQDRQQNLWLGLDNGIDYVAINSPFSLLHSQMGIKGTGYASIIHQGYLYLGTNQGLFYSTWPLTEPSLETFRRVPNLQGQVWGLDIIDGELLACMHEGIFSLKKGRATAVQAGLSTWKLIELTGKPNFVIGGTYSGLVIFEKKSTKKGTTWQFRNRVKGFNESARVIAEDPQDGAIWVSHAYKGLYRIQLQDDFQEAQVDFFGEDDGLPSNISINVTSVRDEIIFTTPKGVYRFDATSQRFLPYENFNESLGGTPFLYRLIEDEAGWIWFSSDREFGYLRVMEKGFLREKQVEAQYFNHLREGQVDGFEHVFHAENGHVFIGTEEGFVHHFVSQPDTSLASFAPLIRNIVSISRVDSTIAIQGSPQTLKLPYHLNALRFSFAAPFFEPSGQIQYRCRLEGLDNEWSTWSERSEEEFTNLPYGKYTLHLESKNSLGIVSQPTTLSFEITPPWYATLVAKGAYFLLAALLIVALFFLYSRKLEKERAALRKAQETTLARKEAEFIEEKEKTKAEIIQLRNKNLQADIQYKNAQLASATMHLVQKGEILDKIKRDLKKLLKNASADNKRKLQQLIHIVDDDIRLDNDWKQFETHFDQVHENFLKNLKEAYPNLTPKDQKLCAYLRMNLTTKEIAPMMNISVRGVEIARYRLRKKLELETDVNLVDFIMKF
jgi:DNA-binding CsgD family transcriptional regulator